MYKNIIYSLSSKPGIFGTTLYNHFFREYNLPFVYNATAINNKISFTSLLSIFNDTDMFYGFSISMPYKSLSFEFFKDKDILFNDKSIQAFNTIKKSNSIIEGCLTDIYIYKSFLHHLPRNVNKIYIYGKGAMANLAANYFKDRNYKIFFVDRSNLLEDINYCMSSNYSAFINATPVDIRELIDTKKITFFLLDLPVRLNDSCTNSNYFSGFWATKIQFLHQFKFYSGIELESSEIDIACKSLF